MENTLEISLWVFHGSGSAAEEGCVNGVRYTGSLPMFSCLSTAAPHGSRCLLSTHTHCYLTQRHSSRKEKCLLVEKYSFSSSWLLSTRFLKCPLQSPKLLEQPFWWNFFLRKKNDCFLLNCDLAMSYVLKITEIQANDESWLVKTILAAITNKPQILTHWKFVSLTHVKSNVYDLSCKAVFWGWLGTKASSILWL